MKLSTFETRHGARHIGALASDQKSLVDFTAADPALGDMLGLIFFALPVVTRARQHLIVDFFHTMMGPRAKALVSWVGALLMAVYVAALLYFCAKLALQSWNSNIRTQGILRTPVFWPQAGMVLGLVLMWISSLVILFGETRTLFRGRTVGRRP